MKKVVFRSFKENLGCLVLILFLFTSGTACAEKSEWVEKNYDFSKVKRVFILEPVIATNINNGINEKEILELFNEKMKLENVKIIKVKEAVICLKADTGIDIVEMSKTNPSDAGGTLCQNLYRYADIAIYCNVLSYGMGSQYEEGYSYNTTSYKNSYVYGSRGSSAVIQTPVTQTNMVPGGMVPVANANVRWDIYDTKTGKPILARIDSRSRSNSRAFDNTTPKDLFGRIAESFFDDLKDKFKKI